MAAKTLKELEAERQKLAQQLHCFAQGDAPEVTEEKPASPVRQLPAPVLDLKAESA